MAAYSVQAPDGNTYDVEGPEGASDADVRAQVLAQHPEAGQAPQPAAVNPFNVIQTPGQPDTSVGAPFVPPPTVGERVGGAYLGGLSKQLDALRGASRGLEANLPFVDRAVAAAKTYLPQGYGGTGQPYAETLPAEQAKNQAFAAQNPWTDKVAGLAASAPLAAVPGLGGGSLARQALKFGLLGAGARGLEGVSSSPDLTNLPDVGGRAAIGAGTGFATGAVAPYAGAAVSKVVTPLVTPLVAALRGAPAVDAALPTAKTIEPMVKSAYQDVENLGAGYGADAFSSMVKGAVDDAQKANINPLIHPKSSAFLSAMQNMADEGNPISLTQLDQWRQAAGRDLGGSPDKGERFFGQKIKGAIDDFINSEQPVIAGAPSRLDVPPSLVEGRPAQLPVDVDESLQMGKDYADRTRNIRDLAVEFGIVKNGQEFARATPAQQAQINRLGAEFTDPEEHYPWQYFHSEASPMSWSRGDARGWEPPPGASPTVSPRDDLVQSWFNKPGPPTGAPTPVPSGPAPIPPAAPGAPAVPDAAAAIANARDLAQRNFKYQDLAAALRNAEDRAGANTTGNVETSIRQRMIPLQNQRGTNWSPDEAALLQRAIKGGFIQNRLRQVGKLAPTSFFPGIGELVTTLGGAPGLGMGTAAVGYGAKKASEAMERATIRNLTATILAGGKAPVPPSLGPGPTRAAFAAGLAARRQSPQQEPQQ